VGNIPRTLLMIPTWTYVKGKDGLYVNLFIGSTITVGNVAGTDVEMVQQTDYPWNGKVTITVNPKQTKRFSVFVRVPNRHTSELYSSRPEVSGLKALSVNGAAMTPKIERGYAVITRDWKAGDQIELELPLQVQRIKADERIEADRGRVALRYGPLIYSVERADQSDLNLALSQAPLRAEWRGDLLQGVAAIKGAWADGSPMLAIPYYARQNRPSETERVARSETGGDSTINYSGGASPGTGVGVTGARTNATGVASATGPGRSRGGPREPNSMVWMKAQ
jgi:hypothetical protein